jgi:hypothetical protein
LVVDENDVDVFQFGVLNEFADFSGGALTELDVHYICKLIFSCVLL